MQNCGLGQDTKVPIPVYWLAVGRIWVGADHELPFHSTAEPPWSAATQNVVVGHEIASSPPWESMVCSGDQPVPVPPDETPVPLTIRHSPAEGQEMAVGSLVPTANDAVQRVGSCVQVEPFQSSTDPPTTAVHEELVGHETPTRPAW